MRKKMLSVLLTLCMALSLMPTAAATQAAVDADSINTQPAAEAPSLEASEQEPEALTFTSPIIQPVGPIVALDEAVSLRLEPLAENLNTEWAAKLWLGYELDRDWTPASWRIVGYDGAGVAGKRGAATLLAEESSGQNHYTELWYNEYGKYGRSLLPSSMPFHFPSVDKRYLSQRTLQPEAFRLLAPFSDGISGEAVSDELWCLSSQEAYTLDAALRQWNRDWWLRSPGMNEYYAAYVGGDGALYYAGTDVRQKEEKGVRPACYLELDRVGLMTAADNSGHQVFGDIKEALFSAAETGWKLALRCGESELIVRALYKTPRLLSGNTVLATGYDESDDRELVFRHNKAKDLGDYDTITAALTDGSGRLLCYGKASSTEDDSHLLSDEVEYYRDKADKSSFTLPTGLAEGTYTLSLYAEKWNGERTCDFISRCLRQQTITVTGLGVQITAQPEDLSVVHGANETLSAAGKVIGPEVTEGTEDKVSYQWYACDADKSWVSLLSGATGETYRIPAALSTGDYYYFCRVSAADYGVHADSEIAHVTVSGAFGAFTVVNNDVSGSFDGVRYADGVLIFTKPGSYTVRQTAGTDQATTDRISVEMTAETEENREQVGETEFTLTLDGVNIQPAEATGAQWISSSDYFWGPEGVVYESSHDGLTLGPGKITLLVQGENAISGGQGHSGYEAAPVQGGAGLVWRTTNETWSSYPAEGSLTIKGGDENASLHLSGGAGGYDASTVNLWGGGVGGDGLRVDTLIVDGSSPLRLHLQGGNGGDSRGASGGSGGIGLSNAKGQLSVSGNAAVVTVSGGAMGLGDSQQGESYRFGRAANGKISAGEDYTVMAGGHADAELAAVDRDGDGIVTSRLSYLLISADSLAPEPPEQRYYPGMSLGLSGLARSDLVWLGNISMEPPNPEQSHSEPVGSRYQGPVPWQVLNDRGFLLSQYLLGQESVYKPYSYFWDSALYNKMNDMYNGEGTLFDLAEQTAIKPTYIRAKRSNYISGGSSESVNMGLQYTYPLSEGEASSLEPTLGRYITDQLGGAAPWLLRDGDATVSSLCSADNKLLTEEMRRTSIMKAGVRPALNLDAEQVLFTSPARGGKSEAGMESGLTLIPEADKGEWKLTLLDESRQFAAEESTLSAVAGDSVEFGYSGAAVGDNEYISALLLGGDGAPLYYGHIKQPSRESGTAWLEAPAFLPKGDYQLLIFSEQCNGDRHSDYASAFSQLTLTVENAPSLLAGANGVDGFDAGVGYDYIWFGEAPPPSDPYGEESAPLAPAPIKWRVLDNMYSNDDAYGYSFLLSEYLLSWDDVEFNRSAGTVWQNSFAQDWCESLAESGFEPLERAAIKAAACGEEGDSDRLQGDRLFFLSEYEARSWFYGFPSDPSRAAQTPEDTGLSWWLRTEEAENADNVLMVDAEGKICGSSVMFTAPDPESEDENDEITCYGTAAARPALNLSHDAILFTTAADNRSHAAFGAAASYPAHKEWKLTLKDGNDFSVGAALAGGSTNIYVGRSTLLTISHAALSSFTDAAYTHVTAMLTNADGAALCYGFVNDDADSTASTIAIPAGLPVGDYQLFLRAEDWNAAYYTDYASGGAFALTLTVRYPSSDDSTPSVTVPASSDEGSVNVSATLSGDTANISVTDTQLNKIASAGGTATGTVKVDVSGLKADAAVIPAKLVTAAANAAGSEGLEVEFSTGSVALDVTALESVGNKSITVSVEDVKTTELTAAQKETLGDQADTAVIVDVNVLVNGVKTSEFNGGLITVSVPYTPKADEDTSKLVVWYLADDGTITAMNGKYDAVNKAYVFTTTHLSTYVLTSFLFTDVAAGSYYYNAVAWAVANGTTEGTSATTFSPDAICTRAQMVTFLWRAMGSPEPTSTTCPFTDVDANAYYYKAVLWAAEKGITEGTCETTFSPNDTVTRAQVVTLEWRAAGKPAATAANPFNDVASGTYYEDAVLWAVAQKITEGTSAMTFSPIAPCTRAQIVTFLYRHLAK